ncbi:MAG TPA: 50S ribosomal protein L25 [Patescibacteria group bacterium]|nr:50S ribosomal protein L25 [Patescibacteria group bacterium]
MIELKAKIREETGKKTRKIREKGIIPAVLYGPKIKNLSLSVDLKEFERIFKQAGESSLIQLEADNKKFLVLIHAVEIDAIAQKPIHIDFYQPRLDEEITVSVPLVFEGEAPAVKDLGGTLVRNIHELEVKALPQNLPHEIKVDISGLKTFEDDILVKDLIVPKEVKILKEPDETVVFVAEPEKVEEELAKPVEEKVEEVEKVEEKKPVEEAEAGEEEEK